MIKGNKNKLITWLVNQDEDKIFEIKEYKEKRNLSQNAKYYKLLNELALVLKIEITPLEKKDLIDYLYYAMKKKETDNEKQKEFKIKQFNTCNYDIVRIKYLINKIEFNKK